MFKMRKGMSVKFFAGVVYAQFGPRVMFSTDRKDALRVSNDDYPSVLAVLKFVNRCKLINKRTR